MRLMLKSSQKITSNSVSRRTTVLILFIFPILIVFLGWDVFRGSGSIGPTLGFQEISLLSNVLPSDIYEPLSSLALEKRAKVIQHQEVLEKSNFSLAIIAAVTVLITAVLSFLAETNRLKSAAPLITRHFLPIITATILTAQPLFTSKIIEKDRELAGMATTVTFYIDLISQEDDTDAIAEKVELLRAFLNEI